MLLGEITQQLLGHQWDVDPDFDTCRCTFTITADSYHASHSEGVQESVKLKDLEW